MCQSYYANVDGFLAMCGENVCRKHTKIFGKDGTSCQLLSLKRFRGKEGKMFFELLYLQLF